MCTSEMCLVSLEGRGSKDKWTDGIGVVSVSSLSRASGPNLRLRLRKAWLSGMTTGTKFGEDVSGANVLSRQHPPPQHWLMSFVAVSPSPSIRLISVGLSEINVVDARRGRSCSEKLTAATGRSSSLSTTSSTALSGSVTGVMGASESSLLLVLHSMDSPEDFGDVCSGCDLDGRNVSCGISRGSAGIGSSGCEVAVVGICWCSMVCVVDAKGRCDGGGDAMWRKEGCLVDATKGPASANHG